MQNTQIPMYRHACTSTRKCQDLYVPACRTCPLSLRSVLYPQHKKSGTTPHTESGRARTNHCASVAASIVTTRRKVPRKPPALLPLHSPLIQSSSLRRRVLQVMSSPLGWHRTAKRHTAFPQDHEAEKRAKQPQWRASHPDH